MSRSGNGSPPPICSACAEVDPQLLRANVTVALFILVGAVLILPLQDTGSAAFVVTVLAMIVGVVFIGVIALFARSSTPRLPKADDKATGTRYTGRRPGGPPGP